MGKAFQLTISKPCHENWDRMTQVEKGKFCASCQKQVIDFTSMSDRELATFFKKPTGSVCGRFYNDQLNKELEIPKKRIRWVKYFFTIALPAMLASSKAYTQGKVIKCAKSNSHFKDIPIKKKFHISAILPKCNFTNLKTDIIDESPRDIIVGEIKDEIISTEKTIAGNIINEKGNPVAYASIELKRTRFGTITDSAGNFSFKSNIEYPIIAISALGYESSEVVIDSKKINIEIQIKIIELKGLFLGEVVVTSPLRLKKKEPKTDTIPLFTRIFKDTSFNDVKFYPNPATPNSNITIQWSKPEAGDFEIQLMNQQAQIINRMTESFVEKINSVQFPLPTVAPGNYFLVLINQKTGKRITEKIIIQ